MKPNLIMLSEPQTKEAKLVRDLCSPSWQAVMAKIYTALTGRLTLIIEKDGHHFAYLTDTVVGVAPAVRHCAEEAAATLLTRLDHDDAARELGSAEEHWFYPTKINDETIDSV